MESVSVVKNQQCEINIVFSNNVGSSEPYEQEFSKCFIIQVPLFLIDTTISLDINTPSPNSTMPSSSSTTVVQTTFPLGTDNYSA